MFKQRKKIGTILLFTILSFLFTACKNSKQKGVIVNDHPHQKSFRIPDIPQGVKASNEQAEFIIKNYWQNFDFSDTIFIHRPQVTEQIFADYVNLLGQVPVTLAEEGVDVMMKKAEVKNSMFVCFATLCEKYLYDPNSPVRSCI